MTLFIHDLDGETLEELKEKEFSIDATTVPAPNGSDVFNMVFIHRINSMLTVPEMVAIHGTQGIALMDYAGHCIIISNDAYHTIEVK